MGDMRLPEPTYSLDNLAALVELPKRTVRYYIQLGLVDRPVGETRGAHYTPHHLKQLLQIRKWTAAGLSLDRVREIVAGGSTTVPPRPRSAGTVDVWSHLVVADGVEIQLDPARADLSPEEVRAFFRSVMALWRDIRRQDKEKDDA